jgi:hypothetical protein
MRDLLQWSSLLVLFLVLPFSLISCDSSGSNGSNEPDFNQVTVESITLEDFPFTTESNAPWDYGSAPDPGIRILKGENGPVEAETGSINNIGRDALPLEYANTPFTIDDLSAEYSFDLYDVDNGEPDFIGGVVYSFSNLTNNYPESKTIEAAGISYTLELNWSE